MPTFSTAARQQEELLEESPAFAVVPVDHFRGIGKPNAIVRPLRHNREVIEGQHIIHLHPDYKLIHDLEAQIIRNKSDSNNNIGNITTTTTTNNTNVTSNAVVSAKKTDRRHNEFTKELDAKLRRLQNDSSKRSSKNGSSQEVDAKRKPLFITTVPKGVFLQPTKELPTLVPSASTLRRIYAYESRPKLLTTNNLNNNNDINHPNHNVEGDLYKHKIIIAQNQNLESQPQHNTKGATAFISATVNVPRHSCINRNARDHQNPTTYQNVMHDRRVVRGSNFTSSNVQSWNPNFAYAGLLSGKGDGDSLQKEQEARRRQILRKKHVAARNQRGIIGTPPAVRGRKHENVQTEKYLEELFVRPPEMDACCQTDLFLHRPPSPPYVPQKQGQDVATEILDGELFDFDTEVQPIVEVLVGRTIEQALIEVLHEEEIAEMKRQQQQIMAIREAELAELRRLELEDRKLTAEKERRILQDKIAQDLDREMQERITASKLLQGRIDTLLPDILDTVENIKDEKDREEFERQIAPWLAKEVAQEIGQMIDSKELLEDIIREVLIQKKRNLLGSSSPEMEVAVDAPEDEVDFEEEEEAEEGEHAAEGEPAEEEKNVENGDSQ
ncbi:radial spoke head protein 3 homolog A isoform X2 [Culex pipiens pallens]|uniref:radial spoke head protein 3 homolog A isoform X2 n=1 Tax=Culex pipiens pallens TaxID=42434 RepID=UPI001953A999|nr:radial spoke head protein 3 homolog A isoform X2 [Culex pipiens pallens]